jgi:hypothetical protein
VDAVSAFLKTELWVYIVEQLVGNKELVAEN